MLGIYRLLPSRVRSAVNSTVGEPRGSGSGFGAAGRRPLLLGALVLPDDVVEEPRRERGILMG